MNNANAKTIMAREIGEIPDVLSRQIIEGLDLYLKAGQHASTLNLRGFVTCARGTSDHAATFFKYLIEMKTGLPVASIGPSIASVYKTPLKLTDFACVTISQSGGSPDLVALQRAARQGGAHTLAILNETDSPVGRDADTVLPVLAGPEKAVAATKSFVSSLFAILGFVAGYTGDRDLENALRDVPKLARVALECDWSAVQFALARAGSVFTVGRGPGLAVAAEAALKLKETCRIHAEVFSSAEVLHGPVVLAERKFAALVFDPSDQSASSVRSTADSIRKKGADTFLISSDDVADLAVPETGNAFLTPLIQILAFYKLVERLAFELGENADAPEGLNKVTTTI
ncbi:SIS domain-containing protein [Ruegeria haliotis]|nr:SIS domain-containing protein [Ruegeria haliotis]